MDLEDVVPEVWDNGSDGCGALWLNGQGLVQQLWGDVWAGWRYEGWLCSINGSNRSGRCLAAFEIGNAFYVRRSVCFGNLILKTVPLFDRLAFALILEDEIKGICVTSTFQVCAWDFELYE